VTADLYPLQVLVVTLAGWINRGDAEVAPERQLVTLDGCEDGLAQEHAGGAQSAGASSVNFRCSGGATLIFLPGARPSCWMPRPAHGDKVLLEDLLRICCVSCRRMPGNADPRARSYRYLAWADERNSFAAWHDCQVEDQ
jgi:hypothetical protein